jgi:hypothetical protein
LGNAVVKLLCATVPKDGWKWPVRSFNHLLDLVVVNCWLMYHRSCKAAEAAKKPMVVLNALLSCSTHSYLRYTYVHIIFLENKVLKMFKFQFVAFCTLVDFYEIFEEFLKSCHLRTKKVIDFKEAYDYHQISQVL